MLINKEILIGIYSFSDSTFNTWTGLGSNNDWSTNSNWNLNTIPVPYDSLYFGSAARYAPNNNLADGTPYKDIIFNNDAGAYTITGNSFMLYAGGITNNSPNVQTITNNISLSGTVGITFNCNTSAIVLNGVISGSNGLIKNGAGTLALSGACDYTGGTVINDGAIDISSDSTLNGVISGSGSLIKSGIGTLILGGNNTFTGGIVNATGYGQKPIGWIFCNSSNALGTGLFTVLANAQIYVTINNLTLSNNFTINANKVLQIRVERETTTLIVLGNISGQGFIEKTSNGKLVLTGLLTYTGSTRVFAGSIVVARTNGASTATATFTALVLSVEFDVPPTSGMTFRYFPGVTNNTYNSVTLINGGGLSGSYNSLTSTLTII